MEISTQSSLTITGTHSEIEAVLDRIDSVDVSNFKKRQQSFSDVTNRLFESGVRLKVDNKISTIKVVREMTGWGLRESKDWVENNMG